MLLGDLGTSYTKILDTEKAEYRIINTLDLLKSDIRFDVACGHNARLRADRVVNELVALEKGSRRLIGKENFLVVDVGSRDIKYVKMKDGKYEEMDWNALCGATLGFSIELLENHFHIKTSELEKASESLGVTCGVLGMAKIFDKISEGCEISVILSSFIKGIADNIYKFIDEPDFFYLSGGLCNNSLFIKSFDCQVVPLGRFVPLEGLRDFESSGAG
jgi:activator of 2-hydroxyglutaryl-CoA dehydratase